MRRCKWCLSHIRPANPSGKFYDPWTDNQRWVHVVGMEDVCRTHYVWPDDHPEEFALPDRTCSRCGHIWLHHGVRFLDDKGHDCTYNVAGSWQGRTDCTCWNAPAKPIVFNKMRKP